MSRDLNHLRPVFFVAILTFLQCLPAFGRDYVYQNQETRDLTSVTVVNKSRESQPVWVIFYDQEYIGEESFEVPARSAKTLSLDGLKKPQWTFAVLTKSPQVQPISATTTTWDWALGTRYEVKIKNFNVLNLKVFNLFLEKQKIDYRFADSAGNILEQGSFKTAAFRQNLVKTVNVPSGAARLIIQSEEPIQLSSDQLFMSAVDNKRKAGSDMKYFLVQGGRDGTNFIAPMDDPAMIQKAREEILDPQGYIVFADVEVNPSQANRNFASSEKAYWSWSIKKVTGLAQIGADWCQAYPEMIERMLHIFVRQQSVCFRGQRIIRELKPSEVESGFLNPRGTP